MTSWPRSWPSTLASTEPVRPVAGDRRLPDLRGRVHLLGGCHRDRLRLAAHRRLSRGASRATASTTPARWRCSRMNHVPARLAEGFQPSDRDPGGNETVRQRVARLGRGLLPGLAGSRSIRPGSVRHDVPRRPARPCPPRRHAAHLAAAGSGRSASEHPTDRRGRRRTTDGRGGFGGARSSWSASCLRSSSSAGVPGGSAGHGRRQPDVVWRSVVGLARRLGFAPRPSQTVFEY